MSSSPPPTRPTRPLDIAVEAAYRSMVESARAVMGARTLPVNKIRTVFDDAIASSDREAAIVLFALIDDLMTELLREKLSGEVSGGIDQVFFSANGMLASAYGKISLLGGLEWIRHFVYTELMFIRRIRNEFAHHVEYRSFFDSPLRDYINSMKKTETPIIDSFQTGIIPDRFRDAPDIAEIVRSILDEGLTTRAKFLIRTALVIGNMIQDFTIIQAANLHRIHPNNLNDFDSLPENFKELLRTVYRISFLVVRDELFAAVASRLSGAALKTFEMISAEAVADPAFPDRSQATT